jgi:hypothetical protein
MPVPPPRASLLQEILEDRAAGARVSLPTAAGRAPVLRFVVPVAVAVSLLFLVFPFRAEELDVASTAGSAAWLPSGVAYAQADAGPLNRPAPIQPSGAGRLRPVILDYTRTTRDSAGRVVSIGHDRLSLVRVDAGAAPAWRLTRATRYDQLPNQAEAETVLVARADLRMLGRVVVEAPYRRYARIQVIQRFTKDSVAGEMTALATSGGNPHRTFARRLDPRFGPYISGAALPLALAGVSLQPGFRGTLSVLGWAVRDDDVFTPLELRVEGEERVRVPAGTFDCWRLSIRFGGTRVLYWARKSDGFGVRARSETYGTRPPSAESPKVKAIRETVLARESSPP